LYIELLYAIFVLLQTTVFYQQMLAFPRGLCGTMGSRFLHFFKTWLRLGDVASNNQNGSGVDAVYRVVM